MKENHQTGTKKVNMAKIILTMVLAVLLAGECYFGYQLYEKSKQQEILKEDYSTLNSITFGVFSIDLWTDKISAIVGKEIKDFKVTPAQKNQLQTEIEAELHTVINDITNDFTKKQKGIGDKLKKFAFKQFVNPKELHDQVPSFANTIVNRITSKRATNKLKNIAKSEFDELTSQTFDSTGVAIAQLTKKLHAKYKSKNLNDFNQKIEVSLANIRKVTYNYAYAMLGFVVAAIGLWLALRKKIYLHSTLFSMSLLMAITLLITGVTTSIIEVDARLSTLEVSMLGEKLAFTNQVLFYQSKSILGIAEVLIAQPKPDSITVGILIIIFVILLPLLRICARGLHMLCKPFIAENGVTRYLAFESGKWDMADVMVVGILMTYIGLNGILKSQLSGLNMKDEMLYTTTVNFTSLQPGYIIFVGYVTFGFILSYMLKKIVAERCK